MKIIQELSYSQIKNNKKDTIATRLSILLAVVLLGTVVFIIGTLKSEQHSAIVSTMGDYQVSISDLNSSMMKEIFYNEDIKKVSFDKFIKTNLNAIIIEKGAYYKDLKRFEIISGKQANLEDELIVPTRFLKNHKEYKVGSKLIVKGKEYTIVGEYDDYASSFEESILIGVLGDESKENILKNTDGIEVYIWYKSPRDTYTLTKKMLDNFKIDYEKALDTGRLYFNRDILEYKMIYPSGLIPPKYVIADWVESYGICVILVLLFAVMIYGAFNVWNNRDIKELALLKSVGMTENQVKKMIRIKAIRISVVPILVGIVISYVVTNLLFYLTWLNNSITYKNMSNILNEKTRDTEFHFVSFSFPLVFIIFIFAFVMVYLSAIIPARKSAKLNVIAGLTGINERTIKNGKSTIDGKVEVTLAKDYFKTYRSTYRTIIIVMLLSAMVMTFVLVAQSYRTVNSTYGKYHSPYNFTSQIYVSDTLNEQLINDLEQVKGVDELHIYASKSFKFYLKDNKGFESDDLKNAFKRGDKNAEDLYVNIIGLSTDDFDNIISTNQLDKASNYILLNKTPDNNIRPYSFRKYIRITDTNEKELVLRYNADGKQMPIQINGYINDFPFDLEGQTKSGIYIFTRMENLETFTLKYGQDKENLENHYTIQIKAKKNLDQVSNSAERMIASYIPKNDHSTTNDILKQATDKEQLRNEHMLNLGIQMVLIILALSNAYNSFHGNLRARKREFQLLSTTGMTDTQIKKMIDGEVGILFRQVAIFYIMVFILAVFVRSYRSEYDFAFVSKEILLNLNYIPIILIFGVLVLGVLLAICSSIKMILCDDLNYAIKEI